MTISRRTFLRALASCCALSFISGPVRAASSLLFPFGQLPPPERVRRILSAGAPADLLLLAVAPEKLPGLSSFDLSGDNCAWFSSSLCHLTKLGRLSGRASTLSLEKVLALNPDMIIDCGSADGTWRSQASRIAEQTGIPLVLIDGTLADSAQQLRQVGALLGEERRAESQALLAERFLADAALFAGSPAANVRFYAARGARGLETGLRHSLHTEAAELLGLENVAQQADRSGLTQVSMEQLLLWQPDIILTQDPVTWRYICEDPVWQGVDAVAKRQVLLFSGLPFGWLDAPPGINRLLGMRRLQAHFDARLRAGFKDDMREFFTLFYHSELSDAQYQRLMGDA
ncbi:ABC transporter substrate-binding protein [Affinibrenneria salicis]|uniref:ABC transporter substrate-binding protein n=1 Tax=Affinibrenneria salicis TaxID=2590031 RepID=A0A5J5G7E0_9GAMM|nr:ABC transporter substrate-binding protein [Affinibrenneria salicis]KAA9002555.1 ABC transporter substrate-binding protein [Affinibrenneria salicis]KAA9003157.1 ABC transporter substrate-binding protein [Affinibrenneria salicis]